MTSTFRRAARIIERNEGLPDGGVMRLFSQRGPRPGDGRTADAPWAGLVEETPALWVTWFVAAAKRLGQPLPLILTVNGRAVNMTSIPLTFGPRWYWLCPECGRRCEAVYVLGRRAACRQCLRLGYKSQAQRITSVHAWLDLLFDRNSLTARRYRAGEMPAVITDELRRGMNARITALFESMRLDYGETSEPNERTDTGARADAGAMGSPGGAGGRAD